MNVPIRTVVVDDDFMIARIHGKVVQEHPSYKLVGIAHNFAASLTLVEETRPDLILLDVFMPDSSGIDLVQEIRSRRLRSDIILITAAKEKEVVEEGFRFGVFDYLMKPFDLGLLREALSKYAEFKRRLSKTANVDQGMLDDLKRLRSIPHGKPIPSGIDVRTLGLIRNCLSGSTVAKSAEEVARLAGVSRSTARNYLDFLVQEGIAREELLYGTVGRPQRVFLLA